MRAVILVALLAIAVVAQPGPMMGPGGPGGPFGPGGPVGGFGGPGPMMGMGPDDFGMMGIAAEELGSSALNAGLNMANQGMQGMQNIAQLTPLQQQAIQNAAVHAGFPQAQYTLQQHVAQPVLGSTTVLPTQFLGGASSQMQPIFGNQQPIMQTQPILSSQMQPVLAQNAPFVTSAQPTLMTQPILQNQGAYQPIFSGMRNAVIQPIA